MQTIHGCPLKLNFLRIFNTPLAVVPQIKRVTGSKSFLLAIALRRFIQALYGSPNLTFFQDSSIRTPFLQIPILVNVIFNHKPSI